jgi:hypothetical protein
VQATLFGSMGAWRDRHLHVHSVSLASRGRRFGAGFGASTRLSSIAILGVKPLVKNVEKGWALFSKDCRLGKAVTCARGGMGWVRVVFFRARIKFEEP